MPKLNIALLQLKTSPIKHENFTSARRLLTQALTKSPNLDLVVLPECFNSPYSIKLFRQYCEPIPSGETTHFLSNLAKEFNVNLIGGSYPEKTPEGIYNTSTVFNQQGELIAKHRKVHLFDVDIPGKITFQESKVLQPGSKSTVFDISSQRSKTPFKTTVGLGICYDLRFPELAHKMARQPHSSSLLVYPGAFNTITGPLHWELLARARAVDNQCFVALCSPARDPDAKYLAYGHSIIVDPVGRVIAEAGEGEEILTCEIELDDVNEFRKNVPLNEQRRFDVYE
ncbi:hypothetical protein WICPIJ_009876 [Wickerhamomyces pijperi]|uniref:CN hydrolase domain-containing protein n=1 Tax=Wickerhamomyces pijperi TaxID=599730 RepID=A0A9P8TBB7_WICPI|nr:hypothetical protein WICPIJ_009876 [Wickerhamomyces pijperi]